MNTPDLHLLTGAYVLDSLDFEERAAFEHHLVTCPDCLEEVAELRATAARLAVLTSENPPERLRDSVLGQISSTRQAAPLPGPDGRLADDIGDTRPSASRRWQRFALPVAAGILAVLALSAGAVAVHEHGTRGASGYTASDQITAVLTASDARSASTDMGDGRASVVMSPSQGRAVFVANGLEQPAEGKVYELWRIGADGTPVAAGTYLPAKDGSATVLLDGDIDTTKTVAVTVEPHGGSAHPTSDPIAAFTL